MCHPHALSMVLLPLRSVMVTVMVVVTAMAVVIVVPAVVMP